MQPQAQSGIGIISRVNETTRYTLIQEDSMTTTNSLARLLAFSAAALILGACSPGTPPADPYDQSKMDLKPPPAKVSSERHKGAFAEGGSLSMGAELKPLDPAPVKTVRLDTTHKIIEIAPGVKFRSILL